MVKKEGFFTKRSSYLKQTMAILYKKFIILKEYLRRLLQKVGIFE